MEKIKYLLAVWGKLSNHLRMRDRSVKILQYGCQMLLGFYATKLREETITTLRTLKYVSSTSRKAFWLLKSVNHVGSLIQMLESYSYAADEGLANFLDIIEQTALIVYYGYDNLVFFSRTKILSFGEDVMNWWGNMSWFIEDFVCFLATLIRTVLKFKLLMRKTGKLAELSRDPLTRRHFGALINYRDSATGGPDSQPEDNNSSDGLNSVATPTAITSSTPPDSQVKLAARTEQQVVKELLDDVKLLKRQFTDQILSLLIAIFEVSASAEAAGVFKAVVGRGIGDAGMGLSGVVSSTLILLDAVIKANRDLQPQH